MQSYTHNTYKLNNFVTVMHQHTPVCTDKAANTEINADHCETGSYRDNTNHQPALTFNTNLGIEYLKLVKQI